MSRRGRRRPIGLAGAIVGAGLALTLFAFLALPIVALVLTTSADEFLGGLRHPLAGPALRLSLFTTTVSLVCVVVPGTALAWRLAHGRGRMSRWLETMVQLPVVMPPAVGGIALLLAFGRNGLLGETLSFFGVTVAFTTAAVVMAEVFVSAPFFIHAAVAAFRRVDPNLVIVARSLGASPLRTLFRVEIPLALPGLTSGAAMSWARALGEFGATLMFAGNLSGRTQTLPLAVYTALESDLRAAQAISLVLVAVSFALLLALRTGDAWPASPAPAEARRRA